MYRGFFQTWAYSRLHLLLQALVNIGNTVQKDTAPKLMTELKLEPGPKPRFEKRPSIHVIDIVPVGIVVSIHVFVQCICA